MGLVLYIIRDVGGAGPVHHQGCGWGWYCTSSGVWVGLVLYIIRDVGVTVTRLSSPYYVW